MTSSGRGVDLSVVVPMFNEQDVLPLFYLRLRTALDQLDISYEVVAVDDGSRDDTAQFTQSARADWPELRLVRLLRNSGHQAAIGAGLERSRGDFAITIDADLQDPPEAIGPMYSHRQRSEPRRRLRGARGSLVRFLGEADPCAPVLPPDAAAGRPAAADRRR